LSRFFVQNCEFDDFNPEKHTLEWARNKKQLTSPDLWLFSRLQETIEKYTNELGTCEFNLALATLENFVIEDLSRLYVPMVRKELWTDDEETLNRRLAVYSTLWYVLKTVTLLFNPVTPYISEALHQKVYRKLDPRLAESVNFEEWPKVDQKLRNNKLEEEFKTLFQCVSLSYAARQSAKLKRRWPLNTMVVVASGETVENLKRVEGLIVELANVKTVEYTQEVPKHVMEEGWASAMEEGVQVFLDARRNEALFGEGLMRDLARRVQALRKELGFMPSDVLNAVHLAGLDEENIKLVQPYLTEMKELVRASNVCLHRNREEAKIEWHEAQLDDKTIYLAIG
jgi:valyl-tRNA synthetase